MSKPTDLTNAAALLALLISRGLIRYAGLTDNLPEEAKKMFDEKKELKSSIILKRVEQGTMGGKKIKQDEQNDLKTVLLKINEQYPDINTFEANSQEQKNLTAIAITNAPQIIQPEGPAEVVSMPQSLALEQQQEIFAGRQEIKEQTSKKLKARQERDDAITTLETQTRKQQVGREQIKGKLQKKIEVAKEEAETIKNELALTQDRERTTQQELNRATEMIDTLKEEKKELKEQLEEARRAKDKQAEKLLKDALKKNLKNLNQNKAEYKKIEQRLEKHSEQLTDIKDTTQSISTNVMTLQRQIAGLNLPDTILRDERQSMIPLNQRRSITLNSGLGLDSSQREILRSIVQRQSGTRYADVVDMIAGETHTASPAQIAEALVGLAVSIAIPMPPALIGNLISLASQESGFRNWFDNMFDEYQLEGGQTVITQKKNVKSLEQIENLRTQQISPIEAKSGMGDDVNLREEKTQQKADTKTNAKQKRDARGRYAKKQTAGAILGGATGYALTGEATGAVMGATVGGLIAAMSPAIQPIASALRDRLPDTIPTTEGIKRAVQRQITTDNTPVNIPYPTLSKRGLNTQERARLNNERQNLLDDFEMIQRRQASINNAMVDNTRAGISNDMYTPIARQLIEQARTTRDAITAIEDQLADDPERVRVDMDSKRVNIPYLRGTTEEEKANIPYDEKTEREKYDKGAALAIAAGAAAAGGMTLYKGFMPREQKIEIPANVFTQQQGTESAPMQTMARGLLRPKFIMPDADILEPTPQELAADALEFAMFDFVEPTSEGAQGTVGTNILKALQQENENIRFRGAGVSIPSLYNNGANTLSNDEIKTLFLGHELPPMIFNEMQQGLSEFETSQFDVNNELTAIELFNPYSNYTNVDPGLEENLNMLFEIVP